MLHPSPPPNRKKRNQHETHHHHSSVVRTLHRRLRRGAVSVVQRQSRPHGEQHRYQRASPAAVLQRRHRRSTGHRNAEDGQAGIHSGSHSRPVQPECATAHYRRHSRVRWSRRRQHAHDVTGSGHEQQQARHDRRHCQGLGSLLSNPKWQRKA